MEEMSVDATPQFIPAEKRKLNKRFIYLVIAIILIVVLFFGYKISNSSKSKSSESQSTISAPTNPPETKSPSPTVSPEPTVVPTLEPTTAPTTAPTLNPIDSGTGLDRSKLSVAVENGSGEAGVGKTGADFLTHLGYDVTTTSNADNYDYTNVTIKVKSASSNYLTLLKQDLGSKYTVGDTSSDLPDSNPTDVIVIIGK